MLSKLLLEASNVQFAAILADDLIREPVIDLLRTRGSDVRLRALSGDALPIEAFVQLLPDTLDGLTGLEKIKLAVHGLGRCLGSRFDGDEVAFLASMLSIVGDQLDGVWAVQIGLARDLDGATASRNIVAFSKATQPARFQIVLSVAEMGRVLLDRSSFDLDDDAIAACAVFMLEAENVSPNALLVASSYLLPILLRLQTRPVSPMIVATFPPVHRELAKADNVPEFFRFMPFFDWDRCKAVRRELVNAFMSSSWPPRDLALTACRTNEVDRIIRRIAKQHNGESYLRQIAFDISKLPSGCRNAVESAISEVQGNPSAKYDWRD